MSKSRGRLFREQTWTSHSNLTPKARQPGALPGQLQTLGLSVKGLQAASGSLGTEGNTGGQADRCTRNSTKGFLLSSHLAEGKIQEAVEGSKTGSQRSGAWIRRQCTPHTSDNHNSGPQTGEVMNGVDMLLTEGDRRAFK